MPTLLAPAQPMGDATRRQFIELLGAAGLLTACGSENEAADDQARRAGYPRTISHAGRETTLSTRPERIVLSSYRQLLDALLALDVTPLGYYGIATIEVLPS